MTTYSTVLYRWYLVIEMQTDYVRSRLDRETKKAATAALAAMGLTSSDVIRMLFQRIAVEKRVPNRVSELARDELEAGEGIAFASVDDLMADLNADD